MPGHVPEIEGMTAMGAPTGSYPRRGRWVNGRWVDDPNGPEIFEGGEGIQFAYPRTMADFPDQAAALRMQQNQPQVGPESNPDYLTKIRQTIEGALAGLLKGKTIGPSYFSTPGGEFGFARGDRVSNEEIAPMIQALTSIGNMGKGDFDRQMAEREFGLKSKRSGAEISLLGSQEAKNRSEAERNSAFAGTQEWLREQPPDSVRVTGRGANQQLSPVHQSIWDQISRQIKTTKQAVDAISEVNKQLMMAKFQTPPDQDLIDKLTVTNQMLRKQLTLLGGGDASPAPTPTPAPATSAAEYYRAAIEGD